MIIPYIGTEFLRKTMKSSVKLLGIIFCTAVIMAACKKDPPQEVQSPAQKLRGKVELRGVYGEPVLQNRAGTQANLSGQFQNFPTQTDNSGRFEYSGLADGTYSVSISREGYTPMTLNNILFSKNSPALPVDGEYQILPTITLGMQSVTVFDSTMVSVLYNTEISFQDTVDGELVTIIDTVSADIYFRTVRESPTSFNPSAKFGYRLFIGKAANTSAANHIHTVHGYMSVSNTEVIKLWTQSEWQNLGFQKGDLVYIRVFGDSVDEIYSETPGGQRIYPNLSAESEIASDVIVQF